MPKLPHFHLHRILVDDKPLPLVVSARSQAAVRNHFIDKHIQIERLTPDEAFKAGVEGAVIETVDATSDEPVNAPAPSPAEPGLFYQSIDTTGSTHAPETDATSRPIDGASPGYIAALSEAATL